MEPKNYYVYEMPPIDLWHGTVDLDGLPLEFRERATSLGMIFSTLHSEDKWRNPPRFGFRYELGNCELQLWAFRKQENNGTTVIASPTPPNFDIHGEEPIVDHGIWLVGWEDSPPFAPPILNACL